MVLFGLSQFVAAQQDCSVGIYKIADECGEVRLWAYCPMPANETCYQWSNGGSNNNKFLTVTESGYYSVTVICSNGGEAYSNPFYVEVAPPCNFPPLEILEENFCGKTKLSVVEVPGATYLWSTGAITTSIEVTTSGTYSVKRTIGSNEETAQEPVSVTVFQAPPIVGNNKVCIGEKTALTASGGNAYLWSTGATTSSVQVPKGNYSVTVTGENGCTAFVSTQITEYPVSPAPKVTQSVIDGIITLTSILPSGNLWSNSSTDMTLAPDSEIKPYSLKIKDLNGCYSASSCEMLAGRVVNNLFFCPLQASFAHEVDGKKVKLINTSQGSDQGAIVFWGDSSSDFMADSMMMHEYSSDGIYIVKLVVFMGSEKSEFIGKITINTKTGNGGGTGTMTCPTVAGFNFKVEDKKVTFTNKSSGNEIASYIWTFGSEGTSTQVHPMFVFQQYKDYNVTLYLKNVNGQIIGQVSQIVTLQNVLQPCKREGITIKGKGDGAFFLPGEVTSQTLAERSFNVPGYIDNPRWSTSRINPDNTPLLSYANPGQHEMYFRYKYGNQEFCHVMGYVIGGGLTGVSDTENRSVVDLDIEIGPNPTSDFVRINVPEEFSEHQLILVNQLSMTFYSSSEPGEHQIDLQDQPSGLYIAYLMNLKNGEIVFSKKVIKQ